MGKPKDRDFIETSEGLIFCIVGYLHPPDRYTAYLKYIPSRSGKWRRQGTRYRRTMSYYHVSQMENTYKYLRKNHPDYMFSCPVRNIEISAVPESRVKKYYHPRERLSTLVEQGAKDSLERKLCDLTNYFTDNSDLTLKDLGVTGSILTGTHNPDFSDIDLTVYGVNSSITAKNFLINSRDKDVIASIEKNRRDDFLRNRSNRFHLSRKDLMAIFKRRWNFGIFRGTYFSIHPTRTDDEITESYGERTYYRRGVVTGTGIISDDTESLYLPSVYHLVQSSMENNILIKQLVSYEGIFSGVFYEGEEIEFRGVLEEVMGREKYNRVVIGGAGHPGGYARLVRRS